MAMMLQGSDGIVDEALPLAELAASMRLPDGYETVAGQVIRMQARLRAAIASIEGRTGKALIARNFVFEGTVEAGSRVTVPIAPVGSVLDVQMQQGPESVGLAVETVEPHPHRPIVVLARSMRDGARLTMSVAAGYSAWEQVPAPLREAVLVLARHFDTGEDASSVVDALIAPYRALRIGGVI